MTKTHKAVAAVAALMAVAIVAPACGSDDGDRHQFTLVVHDAEAALTPKTLFSDPPAQNASGVEDATIDRDGKNVGFAETVITMTRATADDAVAMIECDIQLPEGHILFNGAVHLADVGKGAKVPVVGGTGAYKGAAGVVKMVGAADGSITTLTFDFETP